MKKQLLSLIAGMPLLAMAQQNYTITGKVKNIQYPAKVYMIYNVNNSLRKDSAVVVNDQFTLKGQVAVPSKAFIALKQNGKALYSAPAPDQIGVYLENGVIQVNSPDSLVHAHVGGTPLNKDQQDMMDIMSPLLKEEKQLNAAYGKAEGNDGLQIKIRKQFDEFRSKKEEVQIAFVKNHPSSVVSLNLIRSNFDPKADPPKSRMLIGLLSKDLQQSKQALRFLDGLRIVTPITVGSLAPDFSMKNAKDEMVSLSSFKGKYVLLDFWASWCVPCRKENPNVVKAYNAFKDKNFTVLGVSLDGGTNGKTQWLEAIKKDGLPYEQLCDLLGSANAAAGKYLVSEIPTNFLIDPTGKVIAKNLRGSELFNKLQEVLPNAN